MAELLWKNSLVCAALEDQYSPVPNNSEQYIQCCRHLWDKATYKTTCSLSHLREHKFRHNFQDTINPLCSCSLEIESTFHFFLRCQNFITPRTNLMNELRKLDSNILNLDEISLTKLLLYGDSKYENKVNKKI